MSSGDKSEPPPSEGGTPPPSDELSTQASAPDQTARKSSRIVVDFSAGLRPRGGTAAVTVHVLDLSVDGFRVDSMLDLHVGMDVWLRLPGLEPIHAKVAWIDGYLAGCAFERPLHPAVLDMIIARSKG
jgi:hypothetical protein